jgi:putative effector of murein hydrolase LrgA (UPF0299 family)
VMMSFGRLAGEWLPIAVALLASTIAALGVAALTFAALARRAEGANAVARETER